MTNMFEADKVDRQAAKDEKKRKKDAKKRKLQEKKQASHDLVSNILSSMPGNQGMWKKNLVQNFQKSKFSIKNSSFFYQNF